MESIKFENYKAFKTGKIELKPITVLLGANSVGKSALLQLILMLQQTNKAGLKSYKSALKLYGGNINLGEPKNIFRNYNSKKPIEIGIDFTSDRLYQKLKHELIKDISFGMAEIAPYAKEFPINNRISHFLLDYYKEDNLPEVGQFEEYLNHVLSDINSIKKNKKKDTIFDSLLIHFAFRTRSERNLSSMNKNDILYSYSFLKKLSDSLTSKDFSINFSIENQKERLLIKEIVLKNSSMTILSLNRINRQEGGFALRIESDILDLTDNYREKISKTLRSTFIPSNTIFNSINKSSRESPKEDILGSIVSDIFISFQKEIKDYFSEDKINYVSPLRAHPKRYYMLDKAKLNLSLDTLDGDALAEVIKDDQNLKNKVNKWLSSFGLDVDVEVFKEVIHKLKITQNNLSLDITDVGFGISQILPVIIQGFLSQNESLTIIEQPEIHLHPKMQADLADLFIDIVTEGEGKKLLIETHSEYFLKRLRRRIAEGKISYRDVKIYLISPGNRANGSLLEDLNLQPGGAFQYPKDYYSGELLKDSIEFLKINTAK